MKRIVLIQNPTLRDKAKGGLLQSLDGVLLKETMSRYSPCDFEVMSLLSEYKKDYTPEEIGDSIIEFFDNVEPGSLVLVCGIKLMKLLVPRLKRVALNESVGLIFEQQGINFVLCHHPIEVLQNQKLFPEWECAVVRFILGYADNPIIWPHELQVYESSSDNDNILKYFNDHIRDSDYVSYDIETNSLSPYPTNYGAVPTITMIGFATSTHTLILINDAVYCESVQEIFKTSKNFVGHNSFSFDDLWIQVHLGVNEFKSLDDTMILHYATDERRGTHGLKTLGVKFYSLPDYGGALKKYLKEDGVLGGQSQAQDMIKYLDYDVRVTWFLYKDLRAMLTDNQSFVYYDTLKPAADSLREIHKRGVLIDSAYLRNLQTTYEHDVEVLVDEIRSQLGLKEFNINSPVQVAQVLYDRLQLPVPKEGRTTGYDVIEVLAPYDLTGTCMKIRDARQKKVITRNFVEGILTRLNLDNRVRASFMLIGTETGRLACRNPNLQNIPKHFGAEIRSAFIAPEGYTFIECDYSQLELRVAAYLSNDRNMIQAFRDGQDIHRLVASKMYKVDAEDVTDFQRSMAKFVGFGMLYGRSTKAIAEQLRVNLIEENRLEEASDMQVLYRQAEQIVKDFYEGFPDLHRWIETTKTSVRVNGYAESAYKRRRRWSIFTAESVNSSLREGVNSPIQSTGADICLRALTKLENKFCGKHVRPVLTVHDSILFEVMEDQKDFLLKSILDVMEHPDGLEGDMIWRVDSKSGHDWGHLK